MPAFVTDYQAELKKCFDEYQEALSQCSKQLRIAQVHSQIANDKTNEAVYFASDAQGKLKTASDCLDSISSEPY